MAQTRLTNDMRGNIAFDLMRQSFKPRYEPHIAKGEILAQEIFEEILGDNLEWFLKAPKGFFGTLNYFKILVQGQRVPVSFATGPHVFTEVLQLIVEKKQVYKPVPSFLRDFVVEGYEPSPKLAKRYTQLQETFQKLDEEYGRALKNTHVVLNSFSSVDKLIAEWPEAESILKPYIKDSEKKAGLPANTLSTLNQTLGLPLEKDTA